MPSSSDTGRHLGQEDRATGSWEVWVLPLTTLAMGEPLVNELSGQLTFFHSATRRTVPSSQDKLGKEVGGGALWILGGPFPHPG